MFARTLAYLITTVVVAPSCIAMATAASEPLVLDRIVAVVNDEIITENQLNARLPGVKKQLERQRVRLPGEQVLRKGVLDRMVLERLQTQIATQLGLDADDDKVERAIAQLARDNRLDVPGFIKAAAADGVSEAQLREQLRAQILIQQLVEREVNGRIMVSETEVENFLARAQRQGDVNAEYNLSHILLAVPETATSEAIAQARQRAQNLWEQLRKGADFEQLALANSQDAKALEAGNIGWKKAGQLPTLFANSLASLEIGGVSEVLRSPNGFHILKLNDKRGGERHAVTQNRVRHILIRPNELVSLGDAYNKIVKLRARIEDGDDFAALAKANSDDTGSGASGGDLGWVNPGQTVREFEKAMNSLAPNELSAPVRTNYGWHLIQVLERRQQDMSTERNAASARQQLHARKADERYEQWLRQLRDEAFVEYKLQ